MLEREAMVEARRLRLQGGQRIQRDLTFSVRTASSVILQCDSRFEVIVAAAQIASRQCVHVRRKGHDRNVDCQHRAKARSS
jgi:hypothetical protein